MNDLKQHYALACAGTCQGTHAVIENRRTKTSCDMQLTQKQEKIENVHDFHPDFDWIQGKHNRVFIVVLHRDVIDSRQVDAPLGMTLSIVASIRQPYRCDRIDKI